MAQKKVHSYWNGHLRLSLITFPVRLHAAVVEAEKIRLHKVERGTGERIHYQNVTDDGDVVEPDDIVKGYEYEKGRYVEIEDEELKKLRVESSHMIDIVQFTASSEIDPIYFDRPFYLVPDGKLAHEAYITLRDALRQSKKIALGQITIAGKERIAAIKPACNGMVLETLRYEYEVRECSEIFSEVPAAGKVSDDQLELAEALIKKKTARFNPQKFKDTYQEGLQEIIDAKLHHRKIKAPAAAKNPTNVVNIMDALKRSLAQGGEAEAKKPASKKGKPKGKAKTKVKKKSQTKAKAKKPAARAASSRRKAG